MRLAVQPELDSGLIKEIIAAFGVGPGEFTFFEIFFYIIKIFGYLRLITRGDKIYNILAGVQRDGAYDLFLGNRLIETDPARFKQSLVFQRGIRARQASGIFPGTAGC